MIKEAILIAGGAAIAGAGKAVKMTGEKINEVQKQRFNKVVEQHKKEETDHEQIWVDEQELKKRKLLEEKVYHQYSFFNLEDQLIFRARSGIIKNKKKADIQNSQKEKIASIEETGAIVAGDRQHPVDYQNMCGYEMNIGGRNSMSSMLPDSITIGGTTLPISFPSSGSSSGTTTGGIPMNPSGTFSITASIALTGAQILGTIVNGIAIDMANITNQKTEYTTRTNVKTTYTSILIMEQTLQLLDSSLQNMLQLLAATEASVKAGASEQVNADKINVQVASMRNSIRANERTLNVLYNSMLLMLGADVDAKIELSTPLEEVLDINHAARLTLGGFKIEDNYDYQLLQQSEKLARRQVTLAWMDFTPTLSAYYQYSDKTYFGKDAGFNMTPPNMIGASVSMPIFQSGTRVAKIKNAKIGLMENLNSKHQAEDGLKVQYNQLCHDLVSAIENYTIQRNNLDVTQRVFRNVSEKYTYGHASNLEVTNASTDIITAQSNYIQAVLSIVQAQVALENLLGPSAEQR